MMPFQFSHTITKLCRPLNYFFSIFNNDHHQSENNLCAGETKKYIDVTFMFLQLRKGQNNNIQMLYES